MLYLAIFIFFFLKIYTTLKIYLNMNRFQILTARFVRNNGSKLFLICVFIQWINSLIFWIWNIKEYLVTNSYFLPTLEHWLIPNQSWLSFVLWGGGTVGYLRGSLSSLVCVLCKYPDTPELSRKWPVFRRIKTLAQYYFYLDTSLKKNIL